jgi:hypothetical protein
MGNDYQVFAEAGNNGLRIRFEAAQGPGGGQSGIVIGIARHSDESRLGKGSAAVLAQGPGHSLPHLWIRMSESREQALDGFRAGRFKHPRGQAGGGGFVLTILGRRCEPGRAPSQPGDLAGLRVSV